MQAGNRPTGLSTARAGDQYKEAFCRQKLPPNMHVMVVRGDNGRRGCCEWCVESCGSVTEARHQKLR